MSEQIQFPPVATRPVFLGSINRPNSRIDSHKAIINPDTGHVYGVVSSDYELTTHERMLEIVSDAIEKSPEFGKPTLTTKFYDDGAKMRASFVFKDVDVTVGRHDHINPQVEVLNSYDLGWSRKLFFGAYRLVCTNGLIIGVKEFSYRSKHLGQFNVEGLQESLGFAMNNFSEQRRVWEGWIDRLTTPDQYERVMESLPLSQKDVLAIGNEVEISSDKTIDDIRTKTLSYWLFFNIVCQYLTHRVQSHLKRAAIESAMRRAF